MASWVWGPISREQLLQLVSLHVLVDLQNVAQELRERRETVRSAGHLADDIDPAAQERQEVGARARVLEAERGQLGHGGERAGSEILVGDLREVVEQVLELDEVARDDGPDLGRHGEHVAEPARRGPRGLAVIHHDRDDHGEGGGLGVPAEPLLPDPDLIAQQAEGHRAIPGLGRSALVLEQEVGEELASVVPLRREQQVGVLLAQLGRDEVGRGRREGLPVDRLRDGVGDDRAQDPARMLGLAEETFEDGVVGVWSCRRHRSASVEGASCMGSLLGTGPVRYGISPVMARGRPCRTLCQ